MDEQYNLNPALQMTGNKMTGDMNFVGIFYIIIGALYSITIVGALIGIPLIISGLRLRESSDSFKSYLSSNDQNMLVNALEKQGRFFFIQKVLIIIAIVLFVLEIILVISFSAFLFHSMNMGQFS
jgi:Family of unknown function (DUF5362)